MRVVVPAGLDTDGLGTFTGEVERPAPPRETALLKARLAIETTGLPRALASEGSFGPHPALGFVPAVRGFPNRAFASSIASGFGPGSDIASSVHARASRAGTRLPKGSPNSRLWGASSRTQHNEKSLFHGRSRR